MDDLDFEPEVNPTESEIQKGDEDMEDVVPLPKKITHEDEDYVPDKVEIIKRLRCNQCEFLKFKNIDQWKNHIVGHWRLSGMKTEYKVVCFSEDCDYSPKDDNFDERLSKMGSHFIKVHQFSQDAFRRCDICNIDFMEERKYNSHMRKHDESFKCELCKKKITGRSWYEKHQKTCTGDERPKWAREPVVVDPGEDKEVLEIYGKEYDVHWGQVTNTFTKVTRIVARSWIEGKAWAGKGATRDEARSKLIKYLKDHIKKTMEKGLYTLEDGELVPEPDLKETSGTPGKHVKLSCDMCGTRFTKKENLQLHMFMHRGDSRAKKNKNKDT